MNDHVKRHDDIIDFSKRALISLRYRTITKASNQEFYQIQSDRKNSLYVGSYGRGTAINTSDIDMLLILPQNEYQRFELSQGNGPSRLLQVVKKAIQQAYPKSDIRADGQVVKINFSDSMKFEILPAFKKIDGTYVYPDSNMGGNWLSTNPKAEQIAMAEKNESSNGLLLDTCKHLRIIRDTGFSSYHLPGIVIDSFVFKAIDTWRWCPKESTPRRYSGQYEQKLLKFWEDNLKNSKTIYAPGSNDTVELSNCNHVLEKVLHRMAD